MTYRNVVDVKRVRPLSGDKNNDQQSHQRSTNQRHRRAHHNRPMYPTTRLLRLFFFFFFDVSFSSRHASCCCRCSTALTVLVVVVVAVVAVVVVVVVDVCVGGHGRQRCCQASYAAARSATHSSRSLGCSSSFLRVMGKFYYTPPSAPALRVTCRELHWLVTAVRPSRRSNITLNSAGRHQSLSALCHAFTRIYSDSRR